jgi:threonine synthase
MTTVTHLECSLTGKQYEAGKLWNLSEAGGPLLVRYDLETARQSWNREWIPNTHPCCRCGIRRISSP